MASLLLGLLAPGAVGQIEGAAVNSVSARGMAYLVGSVEAREAAEEDDDAVSRGDDTADDDAVFRGMGSMGGATWDGDGTNPSMLLVELSADGACDACGGGGKLTRLTMTLTGANGGRNTQGAYGKFSVVGNVRDANAGGRGWFTVTNSMNAVSKMVQTGTDFTIDVSDAMTAWRMSDRYATDVAEYRSQVASRVGDEEDASPLSESELEQELWRHHHGSSGSGGKFPAQLDVYISHNNRRVSTVSFHTSCSYPLLQGEQFGPLVVTGFSDTGGQTEVGCTPYVGSSAGVFHDDGHHGMGMGHTGHTGMGRSGHSGHTGYHHGALAYISQDLLGKNPPPFPPRTNLNPSTWCEPKKYGLLFRRPPDSGHHKV